MNDTNWLALAAVAWDNSSLKDEEIALWDLKGLENSLYPFTRPWKSQCWKNLWVYGTTIRVNQFYCPLGVWVFGYHVGSEDITNKVGTFLSLQFKCQLTKFKEN